MQSLTPVRFAAKDGPFMQALEDALKCCGVNKQAYHGGSFIGNHVHKCLTVNTSNVNARSIRVYCGQSINHQSIRM